MKSLAELRRRWGSQHFKCVPARVLASLPLRPQDRRLLKNVGLPTGPKKALKLYLRFEDVDIVHRPTRAVRLSDAGVEIGRRFPKTGHKEIDRWGDLTKFTVLGEAPNDYGKGEGFFNRFVCVDAVFGKVWWIYTTLLKGRTDCVFLNSSLSGYLKCLLAYKEFREAWVPLLDKFNDADEETMERDYRPGAKAVHNRFLKRLAKADPVGFKRGFWECHAWNEAILMEIW